MYRVRATAGFNRFFVSKYCIRRDQSLRADIVSARCRSPPFPLPTHENYQCWRIVFNCVIYITDMVCTQWASCVHAHCSNFYFDVEALQNFVFICLIRFQRQKFLIPIILLDERALLTLITTVYYTLIFQSKHTVKANFYHL